MNNTPLTQVPKQESLVEHGDTPLEFWVRSRSRHDTEHKVVLADPDHNGHDSCDCRWFITTCWPSIRRGTLKRCWHIEMARAAFTDWVIPIFRAQDKNPTVDDQV